MQHYLHIHCALYAVWFETHDKIPVLRHSEHGLTPIPVSLNSKRALCT